MSGLAHSVSLAEAQAQTQKKKHSHEHHHHGDQAKQHGVQAKHHGDQAKQHGDQAKHHGDQTKHHAGGHSHGHGRGGTREENEGKSYYSKDGPIAYTTRNSLRPHPLQKQLQEKTLKEAKMAGMLGAPEILQLCSNMIQMIGGKKCLDVGMFTGASALSWALAIPEGGEVHTMDVSDTEYVKVGKAIIESDPTIKAKINVHLRPATETLDKFIADGQSGTFDFAFIDADKSNYPNYYEKCLTLLRPGGFIAIDNALGMGRLGRLDDAAIAEMPDIKAIDSLNKQIHADKRVNCSFLTTGDGLMLAFKK